MHRSTQPELDPDLPSTPSVLDAIGDLPAPTADDPDVAVTYVHEARTPYQRSARGELAIDVLDAEPVVAAEAQMTLQELCM